MNVLPFDGQPISRAGIYAGVPMSRYHGADLCVGPSISSTGLRTIFGQSEAHYWAQSPYNPDAEPKKPSEALILGRAAHHALLGESDFLKEFVWRPAIVEGEPWQGNRKACKKFLNDSEAAGLTVLLPEWRKQIVGMRAGLAANPLVDPNGAARVLDGLVEHTIVWQDEETGIWLKARPDVIPVGTDDVADLKTAADVRDDAIQKAIGDNHLNMQGAVVGMGWRAVFGREMAGFSLVFIEKTAPYIARVATVKAQDLELGERQARLALRLFARGLKTGHWPGPGGTQADAAHVEIKPWARTQAEARISEIQQELAA